MSVVFSYPEPLILNSFYQNRPSVSTVLEYSISTIQVRGHTAEVEASFRHHGPPGTFLCFFSAGNDEAVADTSRRVGGALWRKGALRDRLNDAVKQLQAAERGKDPELQDPVCLSTGVKQPCGGGGRLGDSFVISSLLILGCLFSPDQKRKKFITIQELPSEIKLQPYHPEMSIK